MMVRPIDLEGGNLSINFTTFGDETTASSRLRAFKMAEALRKLGHSASVNVATGEPCDIQVFQKVRDLKTLRAAHRMDSLTVYDFDDHYLLGDSGARDDIVHFMNLVDLVTVGSRALLEDASRFHDRVVLFENPIDAEPTQQKAQSNELNRIGWFGHQANLEELKRLDLSSGVTTVTGGGDIEWSLDTIDSVLTSFDLILLPLSPTPWNLAKNANRMLKCLGLGIPVLATNTPEHRRVAEQLGLPPDLLIDVDGDWDRRIEELRGKYEVLATEMPDIRLRAWELHGVDVVARRWLESIRETAKAARAPIETADVAHATSAFDVVVVGEADACATTIRSLRVHELPYNSLTAISGDSLKSAMAEFSDLVDCLDQHSDYFQIFNSIEKAMASQSGESILFIQGGTRITRGFFAHLSNLVLERRVWMPRIQFDLPSARLSEVPPTRRVDYLSNPVRPPVLGFDRALYGRASGVQPSLAYLAMWDLTLQLLDTPGVEVVADSIPVAVVDPSHENRELLADYARHIENTQPELRSELPSLEHESDRLLQTLASGVVAKHHARFSEYASTLLPELWRRRESLLRQVSATPIGGQSARPILSLLTPAPGTSQPTLVRNAEGRVSLLDGGLERYVGSRVLAAALEETFGEIRNLGPEETIDNHTPGPPVVLIRDDEGALYCVAGGNRYPVVGFPEPRSASSTDLDRFPLAADSMDIDRANVGRAQTERKRRELQRDISERTRAFDDLEARYRRLATKHDRLANRRVVRVGLRLADFFRPLFKWSR